MEKIGLIFAVLVLLIKISFRAFFEKMKGFSDQPQQTIFVSLQLSFPRHQ